MAERISTLGAGGGDREAARRGEQRLGGEMDGEEEDEQRWVGEVGRGGRWRPTVCDGEWPGGVADKGYAVGGACCFF